MPDYCKYCKKLTGGYAEDTCKICNMYEDGIGIIKSNIWDKKNRTLYKRVCKNCNKAFFLPKNQIPKIKFCSRDCSFLSSRKRIRLLCSSCYSLIERTPSELKNSKNKLHFCDRACKEKAQSLDGGIKEMQPAHYGRGDGKFSYRKRAIKKYGAICNVCNYRKHERMLDVHHIDSNRENNKIENLEVLCIWCHGLKTRKVDFHLPGD